MSIHARTIANGEALYAFFTQNLETGFGRDELLENVDIVPSKSGTVDAALDSAMTYARELAESDGLIIPSATPGNHFTYCLTDDPNKIVRPLMTNKRRVLGAQRVEKRHSDAMEPRLNSLSDNVRFLVKAMLKSSRDEEQAIQERKKREEDLVLAVIGAMNEKDEQQGSEDA